MGSKLPFVSVVLSIATFIAEGAMSISSYKNDCLALLLFVVAIMLAVTALVSYFLNNRALKRNRHKLGEFLALGDRLFLISVTSERELQEWIKSFQAWYNNTTDWISKHMSKEDGRRFTSIAGANLTLYWRGAFGGYMGWTEPLALDRWG
jgi:hypothetical protein